VIGLDSKVEQLIPVERDHSTLVKFDHKSDRTYKTAVDALKNVLLLEQFGYNPRRRGPSATEAFQSVVQGKKGTSLAGLLLKKGADPNCFISNKPALHVAVKNKDFTLLMHLSVRANINKQDPDGDTALHIAARSNKYRKAVQYLCEEGADTTVKNNDGETALHGAARFGRVRIARCLIQGRAETNAMDKFGDTPLHNAASQGDNRMVDCLLQNACNINAVNMRSQTPLHFAVVARSESTAAKLAAHGKSDLDIKDENGDTVLHYAAHYGLVSLVQRFLRYGQSSHRSTP
jgi:ankyrin repeat protein